ncbi:Cyclin-dependent protein kinase inhibitor SMR9 [Citrus sinensis]|uniref:Cyclin-dependent protein kinase inhibitor SMR9 n=2 Tax=Citrus sinensis TaxID=2711 RepID=A0ACB8MVV1_CITSI|nr:cyclin-dependent protein kinase inhibitor SMR9 [Citrus sinensis]KAH9741323.1 Cyclin-dependent protein kinase inhibitor SMR9 [Citrus sinensis]KAH9789825.1 cyclin-dependent protein kinase inhibitor SMR9 [Citrus sinensis]KDO61247.1 hypothetical protein CISIN_1g041027mg [Citrus sinensis]GAY47129.1 hypothetical protein CUMW_102280 [Citrus unshiu]
MAPSDTMIRTRRTTTKSTTRAESAAAAKAKATKPRRAQYKRQQKQKQKQHVAQIKQPKINNVEDLLPSTSSTTTTTTTTTTKNLLLLDHDDDTSSSSSSGSGCSTPKAQRFRIPEIVTCPPAPKKQRVVSNCSSLQRNPSSRPIAFFAPPDLELFFFFALRDISV